MIARCGELRAPHWAHKGRLFCDPWWENETEWHRAWKDLFPADWQEIVHVAGDGERHIADVKTGDGWVIEFQHSYIRSEERRSREAFYPRLVWLVDGTRRKRDRSQLINAWNQGVQVGQNWLRKASLDDCGLLREWAGGKAPIFFDLGDVEALWCLFTKSTNEFWAYISPFSRAQFVECHRSTTTDTARQFDELVNGIPKLIAAYESRAAIQPLRWDPLRPRSPRRPFRL
jgi:hypothetical protein